MKKTVAKMALSTVLFAGSTVLFGLGSAAHADFDPNATYKIVNQNSGKVMDVEHKSTSRAFIHQWTYLGLPNQHWKVEKHIFDSTSYTIRNVNSGLYLNAYININGGSVQQGAWANDNGVKFKIMSNGSGYEIASAVSYYRLDVEHNSFADGADIHLWQPLSGITSQIWRFEAI